MGGFSMNKVLGTIKKRQTFGGSSADETPIDPANETPEAVATRCVGDDVIFLPSIVEAAVASPAAAAECARLIRKFMNRDYWSKSSYQYNAIMLIRILADNPGKGFTRFIDKKFCDAAKELLRSGRDGNVRQMLMETLDTFENTKADDEGLALIIEMWKKEKEKAHKAYGVSTRVASSGMMMAPPFNPYQPHAYPPQAHQPRQQQHSKRLPDPVELANRLEEGRTSAKLLEQVVACTPPSEVLSNDLIKEFSDRCTSASRSIQGYMAAENPGPDNDTMESLIDTNEQIQQALNQHHRAVLQAKKQFGPPADRSDTSSPAQQQPSPVGPPVGGPPIPTRKPAPSGSNSNSNSNGKGKATFDNSSSSAAIAGPSRSTSATPRHDNDNDDDDNQDPFRDPPPEASSSRPLGDSGPPRLSFEPFHPGFIGGAGAGGSSSSAATATGEKGLPRAPEPVTPVSDDDSSDAYRATPKQGGGHVYRY
ncbi:hypothetical protein C8A00DRAFT_43408 [Chaetomidium leptoderma]|uniref:GAT domain-containing protein n=1 Tax=Chaetomidium leptoderma TaxID=669021 RepID=A0AAN6ZWQ5_9PEZI|nr:hypothetical protein C8A00DRAFT_43408 [Chaetomidium leptoderma]